MPTYIATYYTDANYAEHEFKAKTPKQALAAAREMEGGDDGSLYFESYDEGQPVDEIVIRDKAGKDVALWLSEERCLRRPAPDMLAALEQALVALNTAPRFKVPILGVVDSYAVAAICEAAIARAKPAWPELTNGQFCSISGQTENALAPGRGNPPRIAAPRRRRRHECHGLPHLWHPAQHAHRLPGPDRLVCRS